MRDLASANEYFRHDAYALDTSGIVIAAASPDYAKCIMKIDGRHKNARGFVMGGAICTLADLAFAVASTSEETGCVTVSSTVTYLRPAAGAVLTAETSCLQSGRRTCTMEVAVRDEAGSEVAHAVMTGVRVPKITG